MIVIVMIVSIPGICQSLSCQDIDNYYNWEYKQYNFEKELQKKMGDNYIIGLGIGRSNCSYVEAAENAFVKAFSAVNEKLYIKIHGVVRENSERGKGNNFNTETLLTNMDKYAIAVDSMKIGNYFFVAKVKKVRIKDVLEIQ